MNNEDIIKLNEKRKYYSGLQQSIQPSIKEKKFIDEAESFISDYIKERSIGNPDIFRFDIEVNFSIMKGNSEHIIITIDNSKKDFYYQVCLCLKFYLKVKAPLMKALDFIITHRKIPKPIRQEILDYCNLRNELDDYLALMSENSSYDLSEDINVDIIREMEKENHSEDKNQLIFIDRWADSVINKKNKDIDEEKILGNFIETLRNPESFLKLVYLCQISIEDCAYEFREILQNVLLTDLEKKILSPYYDNPELNKYIAELKNNGVDRNATIDETSNSYQENLNNIVEILNQIKIDTGLIAQQGDNSEIKKLPASESLDDKIVDYFSIPKIYGKLPKDISNNFINNTQEQAKIYFEKKYLEIFRKIAKEIDDQSTIFAFMYMLLMSDCFNRLKLVEKLLPQIEKKIKKNLGISNSTNEWNIFWGKKENACSNVISKLKEAKKEKDDKKTWNAIKFITIEIFELLFHLTAPDAKAKKQKVDIFIDHGKKYENTAFSHDEMNYYESNQHSFEEKHAQSKRVLEKLLDPPAKSIVERQMFRKFVLGYIKPFEQRNQKRSEERNPIDFINDYNVNYNKACVKYWLKNGTEEEKRNCEIIIRNMKDSSNLDIDEPDLRISMYEENLSDLSVKDYNDF